MEHRSEMSLSYCFMSNATTKFLVKHFEWELRETKKQSIWIKWTKLDQQNTTITLIKVPHKFPKDERITNSSNLELQPLPTRVLSIISLLDSWRIKISGPTLRIVNYIKLHFFLSLTISSSSRVSIKPYTVLHLLPAVFIKLYFPLTALYHASSTKRL